MSVLIPIFEKYFFYWVWFMIIALTILYVLMMIWVGKELKMAGKTACRKTDRTTERAVKRLRDMDLTYDLYARIRRRHIDDLIAGTVLIDILYSSLGYVAAGARRKK